MLIDWFTVGAQLLNFIILVWLMKRFLYQPILNAIDAREQRIAAELSDADTKKAEAQAARIEFQHKNEAFDQQRAALLRQASEEAQAERQKLLDAARQAADAFTTKRMETLRNDAQNLNQAISRQTQQEVFAIARKTLSDLASTSLEERLSEVFIRRLRELDSEAKDTLGSALKTATEPLLIRSAFTLPAEHCAAIRQALNKTFSADLTVRFATEPAVISGIELSVNGCKVAWSIAEYIAALEKNVGELLQDQFKPQARPEPDTDTEATPGTAADVTVPEAIK